MEVLLKPYIFFVLCVFYFSINAHSQSIYDKAAKKYNSTESQYTKHKLATSAAHAYAHKQYIPEAFNKIVYSINVDDQKTKKILEKVFAEKGVKAINLMDIGCDSCTNADQVKEYLNRNGFKCLLQITLTSEFESGTTITTNYYQSYGSIMSVSSLTTWRKVSAIFEWYDNNFENLPFLKSEVSKLSKFPKYYSLVTGDFAVSINVPIKLGLVKVLKNK